MTASGLTLFKLLRMDEILTSHLEKRSAAFWHSEIEWKAGIIAGFRLSTYQIRSTRTAEIHSGDVPSHLRTLLDELYSNPKGYEMFEWYKRFKIEQSIISRLISIKYQFNSSIFQSENPTLNKTNERSLLITYVIGLTSSTDDSKLFDTISFKSTIIKKI